VADHPSLTAAEKLERLEAVRASLTGEAESVAPAVALRAALSARDLTNQHMLDLLEAFRRDAVKTRYDDWDDLLDYCRYSAAPVGRFMLDVHGESRDTWPASDALCAALQINNHLQDCGKDFRDLDRVYVPLDALTSAGLDVRALGESRASPALRDVIHRLARRTGDLLKTARPLESGVRDLRLALEVGVIHNLAVDLNQRLLRHDPLSERVHHTKLEALGLALGGAVATLGSRLSARPKRQARA